MKRIFLFILTNIAVLLVLSITLRLLGVESLFQQNGVDLDYRSLLIYSAVIGMSGSLISLALSKAMAIRATGAQVIENPRSAAETWLVETVRQQARAANIGMPQVAIFPSDQPNAFATGARRNAALVAVSTGLLQRMDRGEVEAVLGHEISHVANGDMVTLTLIQGVLNTFVVFLSRVIGDFVDRTLFRSQQDEQHHGPGIGFIVVSLIAQVLLGILASLIVYAFSRRREFRADAGGARLAGTPQMIAALERLKAVHEPLPDQVKAFGIAGVTGSGLRRLFMTHPPIEERIEALRKSTVRA